MKFGTIEFDAAICEALRNGKLVVFVGAGVSMGEPAKFPDFNQLALRIANGKYSEPNETAERFLGRLQQSGKNVHMAAAEMLDTQGKEPNQLHFDLLRLFGTSKNVRIVTTNFDLFLEAAAENIWEDEPEVYTAPALPRGNNFQGIVHLHGSTQKPQGMVLTDADYGRAYLTEGWASQFLIDLFYSYTILFVGYSHEDSVMKYLSRGLPIEHVGKRFAMSEENKLDHWNSLDIQPIPFQQPEGRNDYSLLMYGIHSMADFYSSNIDQCQSMIEQIKDADPNTSPDIGEQALAILSDPMRARLFVRNISSPKWLIWIEKQGILTELFNAKSLSEMSKTYSHWISDKYVGQHPSCIIYLLTKNKGKINPIFWIDICRKIVNINRSLDTVSFKRYVSVLLESALEIRTFYMLWLAEAASERNDSDALLQIYFSMCNGNASYKHYGTYEGADDSDRGILQTDIVHSADAYDTEKTWNLIKPFIPALADRIISHLFGQFSDYHKKLAIWMRNDSKFDIVSFRRNAVDPQIDKETRTSTMNVMIDSILDVFGWYCSDIPKKADYWIDCFINSKVPILVRVAIFVMGMRSNISADKRLKWLLANVDIFESSYTPEVYSFLKSTYKTTSSKVRGKLLNQIVTHRELKYMDCTAEENTEREQFEKLSWLYALDMTHVPVSEYLNQIKVMHPSWEPYPYPEEFTHMTSGGYKPASPYTSEQLLSMNPQKDLDNWLSYKGDSFHGPDQMGLFLEIKNLCKDNFTWGISLFKGLSSSIKWDSKLTSEVLYAWYQRGLSGDEWTQIIPLISFPDLFKNQTNNLARLLSSSINNSALSNVVIEEITSLVFALLPYALSVPITNYQNDLKMLIVNHPVGILVEFLFLRLNRKLRNNEASRETLLREDINWLEEVLEGNYEATACILFYCGFFISTLYVADKPWTEGFIAQFFMSSENNRFQAVWSGLLTNRQFTPSVFAALFPAVSYAAENTGRLNTEDIQGFAELLLFLTCEYTDKDYFKLVISFFQSTNYVGKEAFFSALEERLRTLSKDEKESLWNKWLYQLIHGYSYEFYGKSCVKSFTALLSCLQHLDSLYPSLINEIVNTSINEEIDGLFLGSLDESGLIERYPQESANLLIYLIPKLPSNGYHSIEDIIQRMTIIDYDLQERVNRELLRKDWPMIELRERHESDDY